MIIPSFADIFTEGGVRAWFEANYLELGFSEILKEGSPEYNWRMRRIRKKMFQEHLTPYITKIRPDYLALKDGEWQKVEVEGQSKNYDHYPLQSDVLVCYVHDNFDPIKFDHQRIIEVSHMLEEEWKK